MRPGLSDLAVLLGVTKIMIDNKWYKPDFCRQFTDFPLAGPHRHARAFAAGRLQADYQPKDISGGPSLQDSGLTDEQRRRIGDFCVWDSEQNKVAFISRDEVATRT